MGFNSGVKGLINTHKVLIFHSATDLNNSYNKLISKACDTKFLGIYVESILSWKIHIEQIKYKLRTACYAMRSVKPYITGNTEDGLLCLFSHYYTLRNNTFGELST